jgi:hypothetical protein
VGRRTPPFQEACGTQQKRARANGEDAVRPSGLPLQPAKDALILHESFLAWTAGHVQDIEAWSFVDRRIRRQYETHQVSHGIRIDSEDPMTSAWKA